MGKLKAIIILIIIVLAFGAGFYYFNRGLRDFQKTDVGNLITEVSKDFFNPPPLQIGGRPNQSVLSKNKIIEETNLQRQNNGLAALSENAKLDAAALEKANDMFKNQYFEHTSPSGIDPGQLVLNYGYKYVVAGENLILGNFDSEKELVQAWIDSPGHRANILNKRYSEIGAAVAKGIYKGELVWMGVQEFGLPLSTCPEPGVNLKNEIGDKKTQLDQLSAQIDLEKIKIDNTNPQSAQYNSLVDNYNQLVQQYQTFADTVKNLISQYNGQINVFNQCIKGK